MRLKNGFAPTLDKELKKAPGFSLADCQMPRSLFFYILSLALPVSSNQANAHAQPKPHHRCNNWKIQVYNCLYPVTQHCCRTGQNIRILSINLYHRAAGSNQENQISQQRNRPDRQQILNVFVMCRIENKPCLFQHISHKPSGCQNTKGIRSITEQLMKNRELLIHFQRLSPNISPVCSPYLAPFPFTLASNTIPKTARIAAATIIPQAFTR